MLQMCFVWQLNQAVLSWRCWSNYSSQLPKSDWVSFKVSILEQKSKTGPMQKPNHSLSLSLQHHLLMQVQTSWLSSLRQIQERHAAELLCWHCLPFPSFVGQTARSRFSSCSEHLFQAAHCLDFTLTSWILVAHGNCSCLHHESE